MIAGLFAGLFKGGGAGGVVKTIADVFDKFVETPDEKRAAELLKAKLLARQTELEQEFQLEMVRRETAIIESVNRTMQAEASSRHWAQWLWRPLIGFTFAAVIINNFILLPYLRHSGLGPIDIPAEIWTAMLVILGVAAGTRGWEKVEAVKKGKVSNGS